MNKFELNIPVTETIEQELKQELFLEEAQLSKIVGSVREKGDIYLNVDVASIDSRWEIQKSVRDFGIGFMNSLQSKSAYAQYDIGAMGFNTNDTVAVAMKQLTEVMNKLNPSGVDFSGKRLFRFLYDPVKKYFKNYENADSEIFQIIQTLESGRKVLSYDNTTIALEQVRMKKLVKELIQFIEFGEQLIRYLQYGCEKLQLSGRDQEKVDFLQQEVIEGIRQKLMDFRQMHIVNQQSIISLEIIRKNNMEMIRAIDKAMTVSLTSMKTAITVAAALYNQKVVLSKIESLNKATDSMISSTSDLLSQQGVSIYKKYSKQDITPELLFRAYEEAIDSLNSINEFQKSAYSSIRHTIEEYNRVCGENRFEVRVEENV